MGREVANLEAVVVLVETEAEAAVKVEGVHREAVVREGEVGMEVETETETKAGMQDPELGTEEMEETEAEAEMD